MSLRSTGTGIRLLSVVLAAAGLACAALHPELAPSWLPELVRRAEAARGLAFGSPVPLRQVPREALPALLAREAAHLFPGDRLERVERAGVAVGQLPPGTALRPALLELFGDVAVGFFSPATRTTYVVESGRSHAAADRDPERERVVVHELVHALQAEHAPVADLLAVLWDEADLAFALSALLEGDATWAEQQDAAAMGAGRMATPWELAAELGPGWLAATHPHLPRAVREPLALQYTLGYALAYRLAERAGPPALDAALHDPPLSSEQLLHPERWLDPARRDAPTLLEVASAGELAPGCGEVHRDTLGELGLRLWLQERGATRAEAEAAAAGWDGDRFVVFECADGLAVGLWIRFDSDAEAAEFVAASALRLDDFGARGLRGPLQLVSEGVAVRLSAGLEEPALASALRTLGEARDLTTYLGLREALAARRAGASDPRSPVPKIRSSRSRPAGSRRGRRAPRPPGPGGAASSRDPSGRSP